NVSVIHAAVEERESGYFICDLGSESGTFKNGEQVLDTKIESGDIIQVGEFRIEFFIGVPKPKTAPGETATGIVIPPAIPIATAPPSTAAAPEPAKASAPIPTPPPIPVAPSSPKAPKPPEPVKQAEASKPAPKSQAMETAAAKSSIAPASSIAKSPSAPIDNVMGASSLAGPSFAVGGSPRKSSSSKVQKKEKKKTFAPPSKHTSVRDFVKPTKGTIVEVLVAWRERVISTHHFSKKQVVTVGSQPECDIILPLLSGKVRKLPLLQLESQVTVLMTPDMKGELVRGQTASSFAELSRQNRMVKVGNSFGLNLEQGEMVRLDLSESLSIFVRYVSDSPKPLVAPLLDLSTSEFAGVVFSFVLVAVLWLYMALYTPPKALPDDLGDEPLRTAVIIIPPTPPPPVEKVEVVEAPTPVATPPPQAVKVSNAPTRSQSVTKAPKPDATNLTTKNDPGKSANAAPNKNKTGPRTLTAPKQGGSIKTTDKPASQMKSVQRDVTKSGIFGTFGAGAND
ncbi:MAG: FHA domain-containing protein, partial [Bdellovibrionota bacterium]